jgi:hypothetical protein
MSIGKNYTIELEKPVSNHFFPVDELASGGLQPYLYTMQRKVGKQTSSIGTQC